MEEEIIIRTTMQMEVATKMEMMVQVYNEMCFQFNSY